MNATQTQRYNIVCYGEILWDLLPNGPQPGGAPMNVAYHLQQLGQHPAMISRIGTDDRGKEMLKVLIEKGVSTDYVQLDETYPTGMVHATPNEHHEMEYDIVQPVAWDFIEKKDLLDTLVQQADYFIFGSLAARMETSRNTLMSLLETAKTKVLDINLRPPYYSQSLAELLMHKAAILKTNSDELELICSWYGNYETVEERMTFLQDAFHIPTIVVTKGNKGAIVNVHGKVCSNAGYKVQVTDTVGSGDSFLAAFLSKTISGATPEEALSFACALGALVASRDGGCPSYHIAEIEALMA